MPAICDQPRPRCRRFFLPAVCLLALGGWLLLPPHAYADVSSSINHTGQPTISWTRVGGAVSYELLVRDHFGDTIYSAKTTKTSVAVPLDPGLYFVRVAAIDIFGKPASYSQWRQIQVYRTVPPRPTSVEPKILYQNTGLQELVVSGTDFLPGARCEIVEGNKRLADATVEEAAPDGLRLRVDTAALPKGSYALRVVNPGGNPAANELPVSVLERAQPSLEGMSLSTGYNDETYRGVAVEGAGFVQGIRLVLEHGDTSVEAQNLSIESDGRLVGDFDLAGARPGRYDLVAVDPGGLTARFPGAFTIFAVGTPHFSSISPSVVTIGKAQYRFTVEGSGFIPASVLLLKRGDELQSATLTARPTPTEASITVAGDNLRPGSYDLLIENDLALQTLVRNAVVVRPLAPTSLESISPSAGTDVQVLNGVRLSGRNLRPNEAFYLQNGGARIRIDPRRVSADEAVFDLNLQKIPLGTYDVGVYDHGRLVGELPKGLTVRPASFLSIEVGWPYTIISPTGIQTELGDSAVGAQVVVGMNLGNRFLKPVPVLRRLGLEIDTSYLQLTDGGSASGNAGGLSIVRVGTNLFYKTDFDFPINLIARGGWGLAFSNFGKNTAISATTGSSTDIYVQAGAGAQLLLFHLIPLEIGAEWQRLLYAGANFDTIQFYAQSGIELGF